LDITGRIIASVPCGYPLALHHDGGRVPDEFHGIRVGLPGERSGSLALIFRRERLHGQIAGAQSLGVLQELLDLRTGEGSRQSTGGVPVRTCRVGQAALGLLQLLAREPVRITAEPVPDAVEPGLP
jgi:hypothetical protein